MSIQYIAVTADVVSALAAVSIPFVLFYLAPKFAKSDQRYAKEAIEIELKETLEDIKLEIDGAAGRFDAVGFRNKLTAEDKEKFKALSTKIQTSIDTAIAAYRQAMTDSGKGSLLMNIKVIEAQQINFDMDEDRKADLAKWADSPDRNVTGASASKHFLKIGESISKVENSILGAESPNVG